MPHAASDYFEYEAGEMSKSEPNASLDKYGEILPSPLLDLEREREEDPLLPALPTNPKELEGRCTLRLAELGCRPELIAMSCKINAEKTKEILANLRAKIAEVERDAAWEAHLRRFMNNSSSSELAGEERGSTMNVKKLLTDVDSDSMRIEERDAEQERL